MLLTQILQPACVKVPLESTDKDAAIAEMVDLLHAQGLFADRDAVLDAVMARERIRSTGIGSSLAIPHGKSNAVANLVMGIGIAREPIEFDSIDRKPVTIVILLISPPDQTAMHIQALAKISRLMLDRECKRALETASSAEEVYDLVSERDSQ
ncbi:MAG TPA: PTS sugar transporter subunit IIA [Phycisphaerales bacterium]|nr:PTS sugar transporter subunit IIA [Phycisphaerales bacterium]